MITTFISAFFAKYVVPILIGIGAILVAWINGKSKGYKEASDDHLQDRLDAIQKAEKVNKNLENLSDDALRDKFRNDWVQLPPDQNKDSQ